MNGSIHTWGRGVLCALVVFSTPIIAATEYLKQNWSAKERDWFYTATQGSRLLPLKWFLALERPGLWNGAMAGWNTLFVEVPVKVFNPVKTVLDLLRKEHQSA